MVGARPWREQSKSKASMIHGSWIKEGKAGFGTSSNQMEALGQNNRSEEVLAGEINLSQTTVHLVRNSIATVDNKLVFPALGNA